MRANPYLIDEQASGKRLINLDPSKPGFDEAWLQNTIQNLPEILPVAEIEPVFSRLVPIGREVTVETGSIDHLLISHQGYIVLIETKLWKNPEAKREVVAQAIDYGYSLSKLNYQQLNRKVRDYLAKYEGLQLDLVDWVQDQLGPLEGDVAFFEETVAKNLRLGRFLTLIVGDRIRPSVINMIGYVNRYPGLAMDVALIELQLYRMHQNEDWPLVAVPRVVAKTEIVERSIVQVTVSGADATSVEVQQEKAKTDEHTRKRVTLSEEAFWELLKDNAPDVYGAVVQLDSIYSIRSEIKAVPRAASIAYKFIMPESDETISLFHVDKNGLLCVWPYSIQDQLVRIGLGSDLIEDYRLKTQSLLDMPDGRKNYETPISNVDLDQFVKAVDDFVDVLRASEGEDE